MSGWNTVGRQRSSPAAQHVMKNFVTTALLITLLLIPAENSRAEGDKHWLADRAESADIVALAQLDRIDYRHKRDLPIEGEARLRPLITYRSRAPLKGLIIVREKGLSENECYFPRMAPWDERPRYLLFLITDRETGVIRGHPEGCAIEILVATNGRYAARWPQPAFGGQNGRGDEALQARVEDMSFQGPMARIDASDLLAHQRRARAERDFMRLEDSVLIPTRGIELTGLRQLMQPGLATGDESAQARERLQALRKRMLDSGDSGG